MDVNQDNTLFNQSFIELFEIAQEGLIVSDENYNLLKLNNVAKSIFGLQLDSKHQINLFDLVPNVSKNKAKRSLENITTQPHELLLLKSDGTIFSAQVSGKDVVLDNQKYRFTSVVDLTGLKEKDKKLFEQRKLNSMSELIFNLAHQWRQPLSIINSSVLLLKVKIDFETVTPEDFNENFQAISNNVEYLSKTLDQLSRYTHHIGNKDQTLHSNLFTEVIDQAIE